MARYAPDGRRIAFLRPADDDFERLDLWLHDLQTNRARCLVDARSLGDERQLSEAEKARRERLRVFAAGIVEFQWNRDGSALLFPLAGRLYRLDPDDADAAPEPLTPEALFVTDVRVAASGAVGFVHEQNLWLLPSDAPESTPHPLTRDGGGTVGYGLPDFIAAEEMHRFDGYWFSPAGDRIAVLRVDESPIPSSVRQEIDGDGFSLHEQRYPYAGGPNARVDLGIIDLADGDFRPLDWAAADSEYLARVNWLTDGSGLLIQRQTRDQKRLDLVRLSLDGSPGKLILEEHSDTWINLADDLQLLADGRSALWSSEREDVRRLYRLDLESGELEPLTPADGMVQRLVSVDEPAGHAFVEGTFEHPTRRQLYRVDLGGSDAPVRLTDGTGCHAVRMAPDHAGFLDRHESLDRPPGLALRDAEGELLADLVTNDPARPDHPLHPYLDSRVRPELGELEAEDGQRLCWRLTRPLETAPGRRHPVIVSVYGGPGCSGSRTPSARSCTSTSPAAAGACWNWTIAARPAAGAASSLPSTVAWAPPRWRTRSAASTCCGSWTGSIRTGSASSATATAATWR
ncbi:MAG: DPP IV N-terminal domain-containing protein [Gammaproteobacteria bacterium]|nr:DPP IV N-terminal domain-containing protein [Gammaproteobacteria bacterium]